MSCIISEKYGYPCLDTDMLVHYLYENDELLIEKLATIFGNDIISRGKVDRRLLGSIVFSDKSKLCELNKVVHCSVKAYCRKWLEKCALEGYDAAFVDAPQIFEADMQGDFDKIICVLASPEVRKHRIIIRDRIDSASAEARMKNQMTNEEYLKRSDYIILNEGNDDIPYQIAGILSENGLRT